MDQGIFLFDNQYHIDVIDRVYQRVMETTWDHCMRVQQFMCNQQILRGPLTDFRIDDNLNRKYGFPEGSYTHFISKRLLAGNDRYILQHFVRNHELLSLRQMLQDERFTQQYFFHMADYLFMNLKCLVLQEGTYLIIPIDCPEGVTSAQMEAMLASYDNPYAPSYWTLECRPRVCYGYGEGTVNNLITDDNRVYLKNMLEHRTYLKSEAVNDWKVCLSDRSDNLNLLKPTVGTLGFDETTGDPYIQLSDTFAQHIKTATFGVHCFLFNEGHKVGWAIAPNYLQKSQYLATVFEEEGTASELIASMDGQKLTVMAANPTDGRCLAGGADKQFGSAEDLVAVGFYDQECWIAIPTKMDVGPLYPQNFRVWEYDAETDSLGRLLNTAVRASFPNLYYYKLESDSRLVFVEWYRDDETMGARYDDFSKLYREYVGSEFPFRMADGNVPACLKNFTPLVNHYSTEDFVQRVLLYSSHEYRVDMLIRLLKETGLHYDEIIDGIDSENAVYTTIVYELERMPNLYSRLSHSGSRCSLCVDASMNCMRSYDLFIDGYHIADTRTYWREFRQYIEFDSALVTDHSVIILDLYDYTPQAWAEIPVHSEFTRCVIPESYPIEKVSANDLVVTKPDGERIPMDHLIYGMYATQYVAQIPEYMVDWDQLGITIDDPRIADRVGVQEGQGFRSILFKFIVPTEAEFARLTTTADEILTSADNQVLLVRNGTVFVTTEGLDGQMMEVNKFGKKVRAHDLAVRMKGHISADGDTLQIHNNTVRRQALQRDLGSSTDLVIDHFCGADDPTRLLCYVNGQLRPDVEVDGQIPTHIDRPFPLHLNGSYNSGDLGEVIYLPFPTDRFSVTSDEFGVIHLEGSGVMGLSIHDMIYENGRRIPNSWLVRITNQLVRAPTVNAVYTIIRMHRDSNLYDFEDTDEQSILDKLFKESPGFRQAILELDYVNLHSFANERLITSDLYNLMVRTRASNVVI